MKPLLILFLLGFGMNVLAGDLREKPEAPFSNPEANFKRTMQELRTGYFNKADVSEENLYRAATAGMLEALNAQGADEDDNWNHLYTPREMEDWHIEMTGRLVGIGATLGYNKESGHANVLAVLPGSPAEKAGLQKGDQVLTVDGEKFKGKGLPAMVAKIRGKTGTNVRLKVLRDDDIKEFKIARGLVSVKNFDAKMLNPTTTYIQIGTFSDQTLGKVQNYISSISDKDIKKVIVDLRGNMGGIFEQAVDVADLFLAKGTVIVRTKGQNGKTTEYKAKHDAWKPNAQVVVLVDKGTKSGAELLTGALHEGRKAMVIGQNTHGKWNAQTMTNLDNNYTIKFTTITFETASGKNYQGQGVTPDLAITGPEAAQMDLLEDAPLAKRMAEDAPLHAAMDISVQ